MLHTKFMSRDVCPIVAHSMEVSTVACMWYLSVEIVIGFRYYFEKCGAAEVWASSLPKPTLFQTAKSAATMVDMTRPPDPYDFSIPYFHSDIEVTSASAKGLLVVRETQQPASVPLSPPPYPVTA